MQIVISKLLWDKWNTDHIKKHYVTQKEVEESLGDIFVVFIIGHSNRAISLGRSGKRLITTVLEQQKQTNEYYVVTARDMAEKERSIYRKEKARKGGAA